MLEDDTQTFKRLRISTLAVGDEVLWGEVVNTNASCLAQAVGDMGAVVVQHATVGDEAAAIFEASEALFQHCDVLIVTGGLGPTHDDLTIDALAQGHGVALREDAAALATLKARFNTWGKSMPPANIKQAYIPESSVSLANPLGTAVGVWWPLREGRQILIALPGVPKEMKAMWPELRQRLEQWVTSNTFHLARRQTRDLWFYGMGESHLTEAMGTRMQSTAVAVAPYVREDGYVRLRLSSVEDQASSYFDRFVEELPAAVLPFLLPAGQDSLPPCILEALRQRGMRLAMAESCTGGGLSHAFIQQAGASDCIDASLVTYSNAAKTRHLGVSSALLNTEGAVSASVAKAMAQGVRAFSDAPELCVGISTTGIAGPTGGSPDKPVGLVWIGIALPEGETFAFEARLNPLGERHTLQQRFIHTACLHLWQRLQA